VREIVYRPLYDSTCEGWQKLLGILYVGSETVGQDRLFRQQAIDKSISQYYMMPWVDNLASLTCWSRELDDVYAVSFNDIATYRRADEQYTRILNRKE
jgi:hypothetical protein